MCGIFGQVSGKCINKENLCKLVVHSKQRGADSSGLIYYDSSLYNIARADYSIEKLLNKIKPYNSNVVLGHSRLITNGLTDNQPVVRDHICAVHNGIIVNEKDIWDDLTLERRLRIDSEAIVAIAKEHFNNNGKLEDVSERVLSLCKGIVSCALVIPQKGKIILFSNNGSLYVGRIDEDIYFASERYALSEIRCVDIRQIKKDQCIINIPKTEKDFYIRDDSFRKENLIPEFSYNKQEERILEFDGHNIKRCSKCILPETMPFIKFDSDGVCNYCHNYKTRNSPKSKEDLFSIVESYRRKNDELDCIVPFSGGRDSSYALHLIVNELKMKPVTLYV